MGQPVAPAHQKTGPGPKGPAGINGPAAGLGQAGGQFRHTHRPQQGVEAAQQPSRQDPAGLAQGPGHQAWGAQDAGTDRAAHRAGQTKAQPQHLQQLAGSGIGHGRYRARVGSDLGSQAARWSCVLWLVLAKSLLVELWFMQLVCAHQAVAG